MISSKERVLPSFRLQEASMVAYQNYRNIVNIVPLGRPGRHVLETVEADLGFVCNSLTTMAISAAYM